MVGQASKRRDEIKDILESLNRALEQAVRTRSGFTPEVMRSFEDEGRRSREERTRAQMIDSTPVRRPEPAMERRAPEERREAPVSRRIEISPDMKRQGIEAAVDLGERLELRAAGRRSQGEWATGG